MTQSGKPSTRQLETKTGHGGESEPAKTDQLTVATPATRLPRPQEIRRRRLRLREASHEAPVAGRGDSLVLHQRRQPHHLPAPDRTHLCSLEFRETWYNQDWVCGEWLKGNGVQKLEAMANSTKNGILQMPEVVANNGTVRAGLSVYEAKSLIEQKLKNGMKFDWMKFG
jgi:hypothetical protein